MTTPESTVSLSPPVPQRRAPRLLRLAWWGVRNGLLLLLTAWATLAIYYSNLPWPRGRLALAAVFVALAVGSLWITRRPRGRWVFAAAWLAVLVWFVLIPPLQDRPWRPEVGALSKVLIDGDRVRITNVRNFDFRGRHDFDVRYKDREFLLSRVVSMDLILSYWQIGPVAHTFVSFNFDDGTPPLCISIETRPEVGEGFAPIASMFKQFELIYIVGEEHDLIGSRASHRNEEVFLYRLNATPEGVRRLLGYYLERINELYDRPEWYHLLSNSCTVNIVRYANTAGRPGRFDYRHLLNGWFDQYLFDAGWVTTALPFEELRARSRITDIAKAAEHAPDFSERIRQGLPTIPDAQTTATLTR